MMEVFIVTEENRSSHEEVWNASTAALVRGGKMAVIEGGEGGECLSSFVWRMLWVVRPESSNED